ncbi:MAG: hypothetical protein F4Z72_01455 [Gemmatimonadales bacterium]|uniref:hypothetical protein n=1 Tax=Candidatus Palauibacter irciniicola TaxID=3056733 RepID=UPI0013856B7A|nr:hypothetical protein [Candidatus Palauibacter irciniicola]MYC19704.1 hypothetical protein [Gemmatimonadales bacterium]
MRRRHGVGAIGMEGPRMAVRLAVVRMPLVRMPLVCMRLMECGGPGLRLIAVRHPMLRARLNGSARSDPEEEGRDDGVRIRSDA